MMRTCFANLALSVACFSAIGIAYAQTVDGLVTVRAAFDQFVVWQTTSDPKLLELYSDTATIRTVDRYPDGQTRFKDSTGERFKLFFGMILSQGNGKKPIEEAKFSNVKVRAEGDFVMVTASRYIKSRCYSDDEFFQVYGKRNDGRWFIVQELLNVPMVNYCVGAVRNKKP
jgi:hypothetical protein